jgi:hypothetical protein
MVIAISFFILAQAPLVSPRRVWRAETSASMSAYGKCMAAQADRLEPSGEPAAVVAQATITACERERSDAIAVLIGDLQRRPEAWYRERAEENAEKVVGFMEAKMRDNLVLQIMRRRAEKNQNAPNK